MSGWRKSEKWSEPVNLSLFPLNHLRRRSHLIVRSALLVGACPAGDTYDSRRDTVPTKALICSTICNA